MRVEQLIEQLAELPPHYPVVVEVIVGGDLGTDVLDLESVRLAGLHAPFVELVPAPDPYDTRALIDAGLEHRQQDSDDDAPGAAT